MDSLLKKYMRGDTTLWIVFIMLCVVSVIEMYSALSTLAYKAASHTAPMLRHVAFLAGGALIAIGVHSCSIQIHKNHSLRRTCAVIFSSDCRSFQRT